MPKKSKVGKQRKDKFYKLAKETGFRSRSSFKLIQLNRKFEFLQKSRVLIDLCAAPGGWLQVAHQAMPVSSIIIGVDLVPIRPFANVICLTEDITTDKCRKAVKREIKTWKADTVLHDGAPNVGKNWIHDAFTQNSLTLSALKLATEVLTKGGWFITKVFRSKDYLALVWAFKKLFKRVHVTKPQASRNESAEIFIVCQGYMAPDHIDPKFLDASSLFQDVQGRDETKSNILQITTQKKKKAEGYDEEEPNFAKLKASEFIFCDNHLERLGRCCEIVFDDEDIRDHKLTTEEIKQCCKDIKVLGKADLRYMLTWRKQLRLAIKGLEPEDKKKEIAEQDEEDEIDDAVKQAEEMELTKLQDAKRKKKKILKERRKLHERLNLKMIIKDDEPIIDEDRELFRLSQIKNPKDLSKVEDEHDLEFGLEAPKNNIDDLLSIGFRSSYQSYNRETKENLDLVEEKDEKEESLYSSDDDLSDEIEFESDDENKEEDAETTEAILEGDKNPLVVDLVERPDRVKHTIERWFDKEEFANEQNDDDLELDLLAEKYEKKTPKNNEESKQKPLKQKKLKKSANSENGKERDSVCDNELGEENESGTKKAEKKKKRVRLDPEGMALGSLIVQSKKMKRDIIESAYNRFASNDEHLPDWFVDDEKKHYKKELPVTAEMVREYRERLKEINARPIKKVVEAKARKKRKAIRRLEKARKRAEKITEHPDMSDKEKADQLKAIYKRALPKEEHKVTYVVAKKGAGRRVSRPAGVKGRFKVVDKRMKKDARKEKMEFKSTKTSKKNMQKNKRDARRNNKGKRGR